MVAHGVDHGLRPQAAGELELAAEFAEKLRVPFGVTRVALEAGGNLMARARDARYQALRAALESARTETVVAGRGGTSPLGTMPTIAPKPRSFAFSGAPPAGLAVLPPRAGDLIRPLIRARRADVMAHIQRHDIPYAQDPSNADPRFLRARVRNELLPLMVDLSPRIVEHLCDLADVADAPVLSEVEGIPSILRDMR